MRAATEKQLWALVLLAGVIAAWLLWSLFSQSRAPVGQWVEATPSKVLAAVPKETIRPKVLKVYAKPAKAKLKLPEALVQDDNQYVLASSTLKHDYHPQTVTTVINSETGESMTITRREEYPWFAPQQTGEIGLYYGPKSGGVMVGRLLISEQVIQVKGINGGGTLSIDTDRQVYGGIGLSYKW